MFKSLAVAIVDTVSVLLAGKYCVLEVVADIKLFWKAIAVELNTPEDAYEKFLQDIPGLHHEIDYDNMWIINDEH